MNIGFFVVISMASLLTSSPYGTPSSLPSDQGIECQNLMSVAWSGFEVSVAEDHDAEDGVPAHCLVRGIIDDEIRFELLLPAPDAWNGRFVMGGGGGFVGTVENQLTWLAPDFLKRGFASVGTDTGHQGTAIDASWAIDRRDREINFGFRAVHLTAETAKTIIRMHYGRDIGYSYFIGCSRGGGQAMMESQRFPDDFDGIVSGAPAFNWTGLAAQMVQTQQVMYPNSADLSAPVVTPEIRQLVSSTILERCDAADGLEDGILNNPQDCDFEPGDLPRLMEVMSNRLIFPWNCWGKQTVCPDPQSVGSTCRCVAALRSYPDCQRCAQDNHSRSFLGALGCLVSLRSPASSARRSA